MVSRLSWTLLLALAVARIAPAQAPAEQATAAWPGCYQLQTGPWMVPLGAEQPLRQPPSAFRLETALLDSAQDYRAVSPNPFQRPGHAVIRARWHPIGHDSIDVLWSDGFTGVTLVLAPDLRGIVRQFTDVIGKPQPWAPVTAHRVRCAR